MHYNANTTIIGTVLAHSEEHELNKCQVYSISETGTQSVHLQMRACSMTDLVTCGRRESCVCVCVCV